MTAKRFFVFLSYLLKMLQQEEAATATTTAATATTTEAASATTTAAAAKTNTASAGEQAKRGFFKMPLHYPRYKKADYETMPEWKLDCLLAEYGLPVFGDVAEKRSFAMGAFLWKQ